MKIILTIVAISLAGSFLCSLFEAALYSVTPTRVEQLRRKGALGAKMLARLRTRIDEPIAAILTFNTITHTMGATWAGALVGEIYGNVWVTWFSVAFTISILFVTEIVPKTLGVVHAGKLAPLSAWPIQGMIWLVWPFAWLSLQVTKRLTRGRTAQGPSEEEVLIMADLALQAGRLLPKEKQLIVNALQLNDVTVRELMTPRTVVEYLPAPLTIAEMVTQSGQVVHSRLPVVEGPELEGTVGIAHRRELLEAAARGEVNRTVHEFARPATFIPGTTAANRALEDLLKQRQHLAMVVSERGEVCGVITLEDILEHLLGAEIVDEYDKEVDMQVAARRKARRRLLGRED